MNRFSSWWPALAVSWLAIGYCGCNSPYRSDQGALLGGLGGAGLGAVVGHAVDAIAPECARRSQRLVVNLPADPLWVHADADRLEQVFSNLLINAAKYTPDGGEVALTLERLAQDARLRIRDSGIGIDAAHLTRIFEMFVQVNSTVTRAAGGRGIGLAVVRELVEMHGGSVSASSAGPGSGSEFTVLLPALWARPDETTSV